MIYIQSVRSTLKKGVSVELSPRVVLVAQNGVGKSSIVQSATLATTGTVSDFEGRDEVKAQQALGRLFPAEVEPWAEVTLSDGTAFRWSMERGKDGSYKRPELAAPRTIRWPVQELTELLRGEATTVRAWLEQQLASGTTLEELLKPFPPTVRDTVQRLVKKHKKTDFVTLAKEAKAEARALRMQATKAEGLLETMTVGLDPALPDDQVAELKAKLVELDKTAATGATCSAESYQAQKTELGGEVDKLLALDAEWKALPAVSPEIEKQTETLRALLNLIRTHIALFGEDNCQVCGTQSVKLSKRLIPAEKNLASRADAVELLRKKQELFERMTAQSAAIAGKALVLKGLSVRPSNQERDAIIGKLARHETVARTWTNVIAGKREVYGLRSQADSLSTAAKALETTGKEVLERQKSSFEDKVSAFLLGGEKFAIDLDSGRFGLMRGEQIHSALSGAEWSRVLLALASSQSAGKDPSVLVPEDRAWDADTLTLVMHSLSDSTSQIIIMSTVKPQQVRGWSIVEL
jgi:DNA repair exonuclease SbcCD ATPase subunit